MDTKLSREAVRALMKSQAPNMMDWVNNSRGMELGASQDDALDALFDNVMNRVSDGYDVSLADDAFGNTPELRKSAFDDLYAKLDAASVQSPLNDKDYDSLRGNEVFRGTPYYNEFYNKFIPKTFPANPDEAARVFFEAGALGDRNGPAEMPEYTYDQQLIHDANVDSYIDENHYELLPERKYKRLDAKWR